MQSIRASCAPPHVNAPFYIFFSHTIVLLCAQAREWHPDRHQGDGAAAAQEKFQEISEAYQTLSNEVRRAEYDQALEAAVTQEQQKAAAQKFRAQSWNTKVPDVGERLRNARKEEAGMPPHIIAGTVLFLTGNFIMVLNSLGG